MGGQLNLLRPSADIESCMARVRFRGKSRHALLHCTCLLLAQSGHQLVALHMSAFGGKADMTIALQMSAYHPKRTLTRHVGQAKHFRNASYQWHKSRSFRRDIPHKWLRYPAGSTCFPRAAQKRTFQKPTLSAVSRHQPRARFNASNSDVPSLVPCAKTATTGRSGSSGKQ